MMIGPAPYGQGPRNEELDLSDHHWFDRIRFSGQGLRLSARRIPVGVVGIVVLI